MHILDALSDRAASRRALVAEAARDDIAEFAGERAREAGDIVRDGLMTELALSASSVTKDGRRWSVASIGTEGGRELLALAFPGRVGTGGGGVAFLDALNTTQARPQRLGNRHKKKQPTRGSCINAFSKIGEQLVPS